MFIMLSVRASRRIRPKQTLKFTPYYLSPARIDLVPERMEVPKTMPVVHSAPKVEQRLDWKEMEFETLLCIRLGQNFMLAHISIYG